MMSHNSGVVGTSRTTGQPGTHIIDHGGPNEAPLVVLLHGFGGSALNWQLVGPALALRYRVVAVDLYAHGRSVAPRKLDSESVVSQIAAVIDAESVSKPQSAILVAGSFGATMAFLLARERPETIGAIVAVDGAIPIHPDRRLDLTMTIKRWLISVPGVSRLIFRKTSSMTPREYVELQLTEAGVDPDAVDDGLMTASVELEELRHHDRAAHNSQQRLLRDLLRIFAKGRSFSKMTAAANVPVLWLHSDTDPLIPFDLAKNFVAAHAGWRFRSRTGLGHVPMVVDPDWVADEVLAWLGT